MSLKVIKGGRKAEPRERGYRTAGTRREPSVAERRAAERTVANAKAKQERMAEVQAGILAEAHERLGYRFGGLELVDQTPATVARFRQGMIAAMKEAAGSVEEPGTPELQAEAATRATQAVAAYYQEALCAGAVRVRNLRLCEVPKCRVYPSGQVEACSELDIDVRGIVQSMIERMPSKPT